MVTRWERGAWSHKKQKVGNARRTPVFNLGRPRREGVGFQGAGTGTFHVATAQLLKGQISSWQSDSLDGLFFLFYFFFVLVWPSEASRCGLVQQSGRLG